MSGLQTETGDPSSLDQSEIELRHLRQTIHALRQELEERQAERSESIQRAIATSQGEIVQLKKTAAALRDALEAKQVEKDEAVQQAIADSTGEIGQLRATVRALRDELESLRSANRKRCRRPLPIRPMRSSSFGKP